ncbi:MAG TPA: serine/threonine-protein kinase, partial [Pyrinomonadaceae bacterium]
MNPERWQKIKNLFDVVREIEPQKRRNFLDNACAGDETLRREIEKLIASFESAESFMEKPAAVEVASMFEEKKTLAIRNTTENPTNGRFVAGTILADRYRIVEILGRGGMGEVFKAEDIKLNQTVALKFLPDKLEKDRAALERFHAEVRIARQVSHPNVCRVFDIGEIENQHFLSMEFIDGDDLSSLLRRIGRLPSDRAVEISRQLCYGLRAIHEAGILHRDLKPANVIIDDKGKARITDFGIAGFEEELKTRKERIGTLAYMSPEQITGRGVSQKSDIYSLGLVMYEIFTGKYAFQPNSIRNLSQKHRSTLPTNPSEFVKDINPAVEQTILLCLEKKPPDRPKNALQVALMLQGGDPLQATIAAGEIPTPEMVAAVPKKGALNSAIAVVCLAAIVLLFAVIVLFANKVETHEWLPLEKSPEVLAERADSIVKKLGYTKVPADIDYGFGVNYDYAQYANENDNMSRHWERIRSGQPAVIYFWHRSSPRSLFPRLLYDPFFPGIPLDIDGMTQVVLDTRGRLLEFQAMPPQVIDKKAQTEGVDWAALFAEAGLDIRNYQQTEPNWTPPFFADVVESWEGPHTDHPDVSIRIEAAAFQGKPVYFQIVAPWNKPWRQADENFPPTPDKAWVAITTLLFLSLMVVAFFLARRNLRQGRADAKGTIKITIFVFLIGSAAEMLGAHHIPDLLGESNMFFRIAGTWLSIVASMALFYLALEPYARRHMPNLIISWNRLLAGDFRDPLVGRDILIGGMLGLAYVAGSYLQVLLPDWLGVRSAP